MQTVLYLRLKLKNECKFMHKKVFRVYYNITVYECVILIYKLKNCSINKIKYLKMDKKNL